MPYTASQQNNLDQAMRLLRFVQRTCARQSVGLRALLVPLIARLDELIEQEKIHFDDSETLNGVPVTVNKKDIYLPENLGERSLQWSNAADVSDLVQLTVNLLHEGFHVLCDSDPAAYVDTANILALMILCIRKHRKAFNRAFGSNHRAIVQGLEDNERSERDNGSR